jgi:hypothetical protein
MTAVAPNVLIAENDDVSRLFLAENVPRHIFSLLCPDWLCARSGRPVMSGLPRAARRHRLSVAPRCVVLDAVGVVHAFRAERGRRR